MPPGWNLGNSFDGAPKVTSWGNPAPSQALIDAVHAAGFNTIRIPVTWTDHIGPAPTYTIDPGWMAQVVQTAQWVVDAGMFAFVNTHHDADEEWVSFPDPADATTQARVTAEVTAVWMQIATAFKDFDIHLMFERFNEPHGAVASYSGGDAVEQGELNAYLAACVDAIRGTGGANATRIVMIQPMGASAAQSGIEALVVPNDDPNILISIHDYYPNDFCLGNTQVNWGVSPTAQTDYANLQKSIQQIRGWLPTHSIVIGEWGSMAAQITTQRAAHALAFAQDVTTAGMVPIWWDNGGSYAIFNRTTGAQTFPTIISGIMTGVKNGRAAPSTWATSANP